MQVGDPCGRPRRSRGSPENGQHQTRVSPPGKRCTPRAYRSRIPRCRTWSRPGPAGPTPLRGTGKHADDTGRSGTNWNRHGVQKTVRWRSSQRQSRQNCSNWEQWTVKTWVLRALSAAVHSCRGEADEWGIVGCWRAMHLTVRAVPSSKFQPIPA